MKVFRCFFEFDNGSIKRDEIRFVFSEEGGYEHIKRLLELKLFDSNDCVINDLKIIAIELFDGLVI